MIGQPSRLCFLYAEGLVTPKQHYSGVWCIQRAHTCSRCNDWTNTVGCASCACMRSLAFQLFVRGMGGSAQCLPPVASNLQVACWCCYSFSLWLGLNTNGAAVCAASQRHHSSPPWVHDAPAETVYYGSKKQPLLEELSNTADSARRARALGGATPPPACKRLMHDKTLHEQQRKQ
jgi:hypothetical protein